jgi:hypothetical protein
VKSLWWWFSNIVVLVGSAAYASVRQREMADKDQRSSSKVEKVLHEEESQSMVQKVLVHKICARFSNFLHMVKASLLTVFCEYGTVFLNPLSHISTSNHRVLFPLLLTFFLS